jgi:dTDP-4-amino-4,6-dideoxygalactose transaminase
VVNHIQALTNNKQTTTNNKQQTKLPLGSIGHFGCFSFHETKNIQCGEGGLLAINDDRFLKRAEIIWEKGTNRAEFFRKEVNKYGWVDTGSSFLPADIIAAFLWAQLENLDDIQNKRIQIWEQYYRQLKPLEQKGIIKLPHIPEYATNNAHMFYLLFQNLNQRSETIDFLREKKVNSVFHYLSLHESDFYKNKHDGRQLPESNRYTDCLLRLPFHYKLSENDVDYVGKCLRVNR